MSKTWEGPGKPPIWNETRIYYTILACLGIYLVVMGFKEGWI